MIKNVGKYFYRYIWGYRYDYEVINFLMNPIGMLLKLYIKKVMKSKKNIKDYLENMKLNILH